MKISSTALRRVYQPFDIRYVPYIQQPRPFCMKIISILTRVSRQEAGVIEIPLVLVCTYIYTMYVKGTRSSWRYCYYITINKY